MNEGEEGKLLQLHFQQFFINSAKKDNTQRSGGIGSFTSLNNWKKRWSSWKKMIKEMLRELFSTKTINISVALTDFCPKKPPAFRMPPPHLPEGKSKQNNAGVPLTGSKIVIWQASSTWIPGSAGPSIKVWVGILSTVFRNNSPPDYTKKPLPHILALNSCHVCRMCRRQQTFWLLIIVTIINKHEWIP